MTSSSYFFSDGEKARHSFALVADWVRAINGSDDFENVLTELCDLYSAETAQISRRSRRRDQTRLIGRRDRTDRKLFSRAVRSYAAWHLGDLIHSMRIGSVSYLSETRCESDTAEMLEEAGLADVAVVVIGTNDAYTDFLELHFANPVPSADRNLIATMGPVFTQSWKKRAQGKIEGILNGRPFSISDARPLQAHILDPENPAGLTRCEFRICSLILEGNLPDEIPKILTVSKSTLRSHMRAIYLKTGVSGQVELIHRLHAAAGQQSGAA
ncbi:transcriptional regulator, LuxR family [Roseivivax lentus]|uniref:Transcriptional regulator, LuxR family n=1 Tax=Roseivivax lentus TaxID=633194 RepID=A0A1N7M8R6_9RHOB|nr:LuxR C-terminal-related transcriptional regulator [Roseivivax lentus]SIS82488.1 transcriptional regulator, LuxR family [Roseivivax lentus]